MKEELIHILDESTCLTRRQMKSYLNGTMLPEEIHAAQVHLTTCPLCSMAMEGFEEHNEEALAAIDSLNSGFLKEHFAKISPQIHLNSMAPAAAMTMAERRKNQSQPLWRLASIAAALLLCFGVLWYVEFGRKHPAASSIAQNQTDKVSSPGLQAPASGESTIDQISSAAASGGSNEKKVPAEEKRQPVAEGSSQPMQGSGAVSDFTSQEQNRSARNDAVAFIPPVEPGVPAPAAAAPPETKIETLTMSAAPPPSSSQADKAADQEAVTVARTTEVRVASKSVRPMSAGSSSRPAREAELADDGRSDMDKADELFERGKYGSAVGYYKREMSSGSRNHRHQAAMMTARCYLNMGQKTKAIQVLQGIVEEGGAQKRAAKKMLRNLQDGE